MTVSNPGAGRTDRELGDLDVPALLREGLAPSAAAHAALFSDGAVAGAIAADRLGVHPRSLAFLAEVVRRGGIAHAAGLREPLPGAERAGLARDWLTAASAALAGAGPVSADPAGAGEEFARWLEAVAVILGVRQHSPPPRH